MSIFADGLPPTDANRAPLGPVAFVERAGEVFADRPAVIHGARRLAWVEVRERSRRLAAALRAHGIGRGDAVAVLLPNVPEMIECHYAVPAIGAVINALNVRLDAAALAWQMHHCEARALVTDAAFGAVAGEALRLLDEVHGRRVLVVDVDDAGHEGPRARVGEHEYEALLAAHAPLARLDNPVDEWDAIAVGYTSGTTGEPKGVVTHHRGAYLNAVCNAITWTMPQGARYLWTLPMFHCNGWCFPWTVALVGGTHVCLRRVDGPSILHALREHRADHYCAAPLVQRDDPGRRPRAARGDRSPDPGHGRGRRAAGVDDRRHGPARDRPHARLRADRGVRSGLGRAQARELGRVARGGQDGAERAPGRALRAAGRHDGSWTGTRARRCRPTERRSARSCSAATSS